MITRKPIIATAAALALGLLILAPVVQSQAPAWWAARGVLNTNQPPNNNAPILQGQLKTMAVKTYAELDTLAGAGSNLTALVNAFSNCNNYRPANIGQLKYVSQRFYDRLYELNATSTLPSSLTGHYPWSNRQLTNDDYSIAVIGQAKYCFSFDLWMDSDEEGLKDLEELHLGTNPYVQDSDGDGYTDWEEVHYGSDPLSSNAIPRRSISGTISYSGPQTGATFYVTLRTNGVTGVVAQCQSVSQPSNYTLTNVPVLRTNWAGAWLDSNGNGSNDYWEAQGAASANPLCLTADLTGVNITLSDPDSDSDGLPDWWELVHGLNPFSAADAALDPDNDGLTNLQEYQNGCDLNDADTDNDSLSDGAEVNVHLTNPGVSDTDSDGLSDGAEVNVYHTNPLRVDTDGDSLSDYAEVFTHGTDPTKADTDGDSLSDSAELNVYHTNPLLADTDGDGLIDGFEVRAGRVVSWGGYDQSTVPPGLSVVTAIAAGYAHSLAMKWNGTVVGWGADWYGQSSVPAGLSNVIAVSAGGYHSLALRADGTVVGWGYNSDNQANVPAGLNNVVAIAAGGYHSLALLADGTVVGWGYNGYGQVNVPAGLNNVVAIAAGGHHSLALRADGTVVGWGYNNDGPASVPAGLNNVVALADGGHHSLVLLADGTVVGWGADWYGQATIPAGLDGVIAITAGAYHSMALKSDGTAAGWGDNSYGQASAASGLNSVTALSGGYAHSLALVRVLNPTNADTDGDGLSDAWEVTHDLNPAADDAQADPDNDGLTNLQESQHGTDPHNADTDGDSLSDGDEVNVYGTDPTKADTDGDGDSDADELLTYGTDPLDPADNHVTVKTRVSFTFLARGEEPAPAAEGTSRPFILAPGQGRYVKVHVLPLSNQTFTLRLERIGGTLGAAGFDPAGQGTTIEGVTGTCFVPVYGLEACDLENNIRLSSEICGLARGATNLTVVNVTVTNAPSVVCLGEDYNLTVGLSCPLTQTNIQLSVVRLAGTNGAASLRDPLRSLAATNSLPLSNSCGITLHGDALSPAPDNLALLALVDGDQVLSAPFTVAGFTMTQPHSLWEGETQSVTVAVMPAMPVSLELQTLDDAGQPCTDWDRGRAVFDNNASSVELPAGGAAGIVGIHYSERASNIRLVARLGATASSNQPCFTVVKTFIDAQNPAAYIPCNGTRSIHVETRPVLPVANVLLRLSPQGDGAAVFTAGGGAEVAVTGAQGDYVVRGQSASYRANDIRLSLIVDGQERAYRELCVLGVTIVPFRTIGMRDDICYETTVGVTPWSLNDTASVMLVLRDANGGTPAASFSSLPSDNYIYLADAFRNYTWYDNYGYGWGSVRFWGHRPSLAACDTLLDVVIDGQVCVATNFTVVDLVVSNFAIVPEGRTRSIPVQVLPNDTNVSVAVDLVGWYNDEATFADGQTHAVISGATNLVLRGVRANSEPDTTWLVATSDDGSGWWRGIFFVRRSFTVARVAWDRLGLLAVNENRDVPIEVAPAGSWTNITVALTPSSPTAGAACFDDNGTNRTIPGSSIQQVKGVALSDATGSIRLSATVDGIECKSDDFQVYSFQLGGSSGGLSNIVSELSCGVLCGASKSISVSMTPWPSGRDVRLGLATLEGQGKVTFDPAGQQSELTMTAPGSFPLHAHNPSSQPNNIGLNIRIADGSGMNSVVRNPDANALHARQTAGASKQRSSFKNVESEVGGGGDIINETVRFTAIQVGYSPQSFGTIMVWDNLSLDVSITPELSTNAPLTVTINSNVAAYLTHSCSLGLPTWPSGEYEVGGTLADGTPALGVSYTVYEHGWSYSLDAPSAMPTGTVAQIALHYRCICGETGAVSDVSYTFKGQPVSDNILQAGSEIGVFDLLAYTGGNSVKTSSVTVFMEGADSFEPALSEDGILSATGTFSSNPHVTGGAMTMYPYAHENLAAGDYMFVGFGTYSELLECCVRVIEIPPADTTDQTPSSQSSSPGNNPDNSSSKDPIDTRNGNVSLTERDLAVPCPGLGLQWSRMYQSITSNPVFNQAYRYPQVARESGTLGPGWSHSYNWRLVFTNYVHAELRPTNGEKQPYLMNMEYWHQVARIGTNMYWLDALFDRDELGFLRGTSAAMLPGLGAITYQWKTNIVRQLLVLKSWDGEEYHFTRTFEQSDETTNRFSPHDWTEGDIVPPAGLNRTPTWDNNNGCYEFTLPGEPSMRFDANGRLSEMRDAWNNRVALTYTGSLLTRVAHNNGQALALSYGAGRLTNVVVEGGGPAMSYAYDSQGRLSEATRQASGVADETTRYEYDPFLSTRVNPAGHCYRYAYTEHNDLTPSVRGSGMALYESETATAVQYYAHSVSYGSTPSICYRRNGVDQRFDYSFDVNGSLTGIHGPLDTNGVGPLLSYTFDSGGNIATARTDDPAGGEWMVQSAVYGSNRNPLAVGFGYNAEPANWWSLAWDDAERNPVRITDPEGRVTEMDYIGDQLAHVRTGVGSATTSETALAYTSAGLLAAVTNANGHWVRYEHDQWGNPARVTPQVGPEIVSAFNRLGHLTSLVMPGNRTTMFNPDALGRVHAVTWPDGQSEQFQYDALGNMTNHTDRAGRSTQMTWLPTRKLASVTRWLGSQAVSIRSDYDQQFNTLRITDPLGRNVEGYQLDLQDRPVAVTNIDGQTMQIHYGVGSIVHSIDRFDGSTVSNYYDGEARVTRQTSGSLTTTYDYFRDGSLSGAANEAGAVTMAYDALNRLVALSNAVPNGALTYGYDLAGNVTGVVSAAGATHYEYDEAERLTRQSTPAGDFGYAFNVTNGLVASVSNTVNGLTRRTEYDVLDRLTQMNWLDGTGDVVRSYAYQYSLGGMITNLTRETGERTAYTYDDLDRLVGERKANATGTVYVAAYSYDLAGNRTQQVVNGVTNTATLGTGNKLASWAAGTSIGYDLAGNVTNLTGGGRDLALTWNDRYQVSSVSVSGQVAETYGFDALGRRVAISDGVTTNYMVYDGNQVVADVGSDGSLIRSYVWGSGIDQLAAITVHTGATAVTFFAIRDHLGSVQALVDESGAIVESYKYDAFGTVLGIYDGSGQPLTESAIGNRFLWACKEYSFKTGLYDNRARIYDPVTGRFLSKDPSGISGGMNGYAYCANNPVNCVDYDGLTELWINDVKQEINSLNDFATALRNQDVGAIKSLRIVGHGDLHGGFPLGDNGQILNNGMMSSYMQKYKNRFDKKAKICLDGCGTMNPNDKGNRAADEIQHALPDAEIMGYTGLAGPRFGLFGDTVPRNNSWYSGGINNGWKAWPNVPEKSEWIKLEPGK